METIKWPLSSLPRFEANGMTEGGNTAGFRGGAGHWAACSHLSPHDRWMPVDRGGGGSSDWCAGESI